MWLLWKRGCSKTRGELGFAEDGSRGCYEPFPTPVIFSTIVYCNFRTIERPRSPRVWINWCLWLPPKLHIIEEGSQPAIRLPSLSLFFFPSSFCFLLFLLSLFLKYLTLFLSQSLHLPLAWWNTTTLFLILRILAEATSSSLLILERWVIYPSPFAYQKKKHPNWFQNNRFLCNELITNIVIL